jgi:hypothetical protein
MLCRVSRVFNPKAHRNEIELPYIVEMELPADGFDHRVRRLMEEFLSRQRIRAHFGRRRRHGKLDYCRWCFADPAHADAFHRKFGGNLLGIEKSQRVGDVQVLTARTQRSAAARRVGGAIKSGK